MSTEEFIQFWDKSSFYAGTKVNKEDYEYLKSHLVENFHFAKIIV